MKFNFIKTSPVEILDFEKTIGVELVASQCKDRFQVCFIDRSVTVYGEGKSVDAALIDLCEIISNRSFTFYKYGSSESIRHIPFPTLCHTRKVEIPKEEKTMYGFSSSEKKYYSQLEMAENFANKHFESPLNNCASAEYKYGFKCGVATWIIEQDKTKS